MSERKCITCGISEFEKECFNLIDINAVHICGDCILACHKVIQDEALARVLKRVFPDEQKVSTEVRAPVETCTGGE